MKNHYAVNNNIFDYIHWANEHGLQRYFPFFGTFIRKGLFNYN